MADEEVKPIEEVAEKPTEATQEELPLAVTTEETAEADKPVEEVKTEEKPVEEPPKPIWQDKELKTKHRQLQDAKRREAELLAEVDAQKALLAKFNQGKTEEAPLIPADEIEKRVQAELANRTYLEKSNSVNETGSKAYGNNWSEAIENLTILGGFDMPTMNGVLATDDPAKVLFELGKNPDKYHQIMGLPLERRIIEMGKLAMQPVTKQISSAPAPVSPVGGRAAPAKETLSDTMDDDKWFTTRRQQRLAKFQAAHSPRR